jgi:hypothetical protein
MLLKYLEALGHGGLRVREIQTFAIEKSKTVSNTKVHTLLNTVLLVTNLTI